MLALTLPLCCFVAGRALTGREAVGKIAAFVPLLIPQLHFIGGSVTNDGASIAAASVTWAALLTLTCSGPTRRRLLVLTVAVAVACWTKGTALTLLPCVPIGIAVAFRRARGGGVRHWGRPALLATVGVLGSAFVLGGWWWVLNLVRYGRVQPAGAPSRAQEGIVLDRLGFLEVFVERMRWTFFGEVGVREPPQLAVLTGTLAALFVVCCVVGLFSRRRIADRLLLLLAFGLTVVILFSTTYAAHVVTKGFPGIQGRYLFALLVPIAVLFAAGAVSLVHRFRLRAEVLLPVIALAGVAVPLLAVGIAFGIFYAAPGQSWAGAVDLFLRWAAWPLPVIATPVVAMGAGALVLAWLLGRDSVRRPALVAGPPGPDPAAREGANLVPPAEREPVPAGQ
jgi:hypothetical protein